MNEQKGRKIIGTVVSDKMQETAVVKVGSLLKHKVYGKFLSKSKKYKAHNPENKYTIGDKVEIMETKPMSKTKSFLITKKV